MQSSDRQQDLGQLTGLLIERYGVLISRDGVREVLGYPSLAALDQSARRGHLGFTFFTLPRRRGRYALASDVASYVMRAARPGRPSRAP